MISDREEVVSSFHSATLLTAIGRLSGNANAKGETSEKFQTYTVASPDPGNIVVV
jgi:hypothetical protein